jgi:hypothetical protein
VLKSAPPGLLGHNIPAGLWLMTEVVQASGIRSGALNAYVVICAVVSEDAGCRLLLSLLQEYRLRGGRLILVLHFCYRVSVSEDAGYNSSLMRIGLRGFQLVLASSLSFDS